MDFKNHFAANKLTFQSLLHNQPFPDDVFESIDNLSKIDLMQITSNNIKYYREFIHKLPWKNYQSLKEFIFQRKAFYQNISNEDIEKFINISGKYFIHRKQDNIDKKKSKFCDGKFQNYNVTIINNTDSTINTDILKTKLDDIEIDIAVSYFDDLNRRIRFFSVRTNNPTIHVGKICSRLKIKGANGGGHEKAAGCNMPLTEGIKFVNQMIGV